MTEILVFSKSACFFIKIGCFVSHYIKGTKYSQYMELKIPNALIDISRQKESILWNNFCSESDAGLRERCFPRKIQPYSNTAPWTKMIQVKTHVEIDVKDFVLGELVVMLMNKFTRTKNKVINKPILPGATSWGITKFIYKKYFATNIMIWSQLVYTLSYPWCYHHQSWWYVVIEYC